MCSEKLGNGWMNTYFLCIYYNICMLQNRYEKMLQAHQAPISALVRGAQIPTLFVLNYFPPTYGLNELKSSAHV